jgi:spore coat protein U-like protein
MIVKACAIVLTVACALLVAPQSSHAQGANTCSVTVSGLSFGSYNVFSASAVQSTGSVVFRCGNNVAAVEITLGRGQSSTFNPRVLVSGGESLDYNLYLDAARSLVWGDGTSGTRTYQDSSFPRRQNVPVTIYGEIPASQDVRAGTYTDTITATILF